MKKLTTEIQHDYHFFLRVNNIYGNQILKLMLHSRMLNINKVLIYSFGFLPEIACLQLDHILFQNATWIFIVNLASRSNNSDLILCTIVNNLERCNHEGDFTSKKIYKIMCILYKLILNNFPNRWFRTFIIIATKCIEGGFRWETHYFPFFLNSKRKSTFMCTNEMSCMRTYYLIYNCCTAIFIFGTNFVRRFISVDFIVGKNI